jgi:hypothetical protein
LQTPPSEQVEFVTKETEERVDNPEFVKENDAQDFLSNKKTDEQSGIIVYSSITPKIRIKKENLSFIYLFFDVRSLTDKYDPKN